MPAIPNGSYHPKSLENQVDNNSFRPRDFFWDSVAIYVVTAIAGLAAFDAVTEFLRTGLGGNRVVCTPQSDIDLTTQQADYIDGMCSKDLPHTEFFLAFIVVHGILLLIPHYLWLNHYGGAFDFFFSQASDLQRLRSEDMGCYSDKNRFILQQLTVAFKTYNQNWMFYSYILKLAFQWVLSIAGLVITFFVFNEFQDTLTCSANSTETEWPQPLADEQMLCLFTPLRFYAVIRIAYLLLLSLLLVCLLWSLLWCVVAHPEELGSQDVADFSFQTGMLPEHYVSNVCNRFCWSSQRLCCGPQYGNCQKYCCGPCRCYLYHLLALFPLSGPRIRTNLNFLVMKLFRTDSGLGHVFREMQILQNIENLNSDERSIVHFHRMEQTSSNLARGDLVRDRMEWKIVKKDGKGIFDDGVYKPLELKLHDDEALALHLPLPMPFREALLGFSNMASTNNLALYLTFGSPSFGIATALARVFHRVGVINFNPYFKASNTRAVVEHVYSAAIYEYVTAVDVLSLSTSIKNKFKKGLKLLFNEDEGDDSLATFVVVGPLDKPHYEFTVTHFLNEYSSNIGDRKKKCILLAIHPLEVSGKKTRNEFHPYQPPTKKFKRFASIVDDTDQETALTWPPTTSVSTGIKIDDDAFEPQRIPLMCGKSLSWFHFDTFSHLPKTPGTGSGN